MPELKTKPTEQNVEQFLNSIDDEQQRRDSRTIVRLMREATGSEPRMWGSIVGFGDLHYRYASGRSGDWFVVGFAPRKQQLTLYIASGEIERYQPWLRRLGSHATGMGCVYIKRLADVDQMVLQRLI